MSDIIVGLLVLVLMIVGVFCINSRRNDNDQDILG